MSTPSSTPPGAAYVPYQAYKSKRHSRNLSSPNSILIPNQSPPFISRPLNGIGPPTPFLLPPKLLLDGGNEKDPNNELVDGDHNIPQPDNLEVPERESQVPGLNPLPNGSSTLEVVNTEVIQQPVPPLMATTSAVDKESTALFYYHGDRVGNGSPIATTSQSIIQPASIALELSSVNSYHIPKKATTFRRISPKCAHQGPASHTHNISVSSLPPRLPEKVRNEVHLASASPVALPGAPEHVALPPTGIHNKLSQSSRHSEPHIPQVLAPTSPQLMLNSISTSSVPNEAPVVLPRPALASLSKHVPYRPGFQPRGIYRPLTDDFLTIRRSIRDGEGGGGTKRVERTKLERRLEKLITLHFPYPASSDTLKGNLEKDLSLSVEGPGREHRRASSVFDFQSLRSLNIHDASDILRGVVTGGLSDPTKTDIRAAEQRITPWQDDASVRKCPLCLAAFHPLTNRKHHCRLCGQIICSLPIKRPQRTVLCSTLFVVDAQTRQIEEVGEGVDYGVKRRKIAQNPDQPGSQEEEDKFLKGVRICRECRPILLRQQYYRQSRVVPDFAKLYENFISLEVDIEESLPKFQELLMTLSLRDQPTKDASAARKRLLNSFAQYDKLSKRIRSLPCPNGAGSSQDRVQAAIMTRANIFLQKNMFPLQSLPTPQPSSKVSGASNFEHKTKGTELSQVKIDIDSALAHTVQPLLEQESLLESFVEEAQAQRKFEDVKTLKVNLVEIRQEIERLLDGNKPQQHP